MIKLEDVYIIGKIGKPHGVKGEVSFHFTDDVFDRTDADYLFLMIDGLLVPFFMEEYRFKSDETALMKFANIDTQERAKDLTGCEVFFPRSVEDTDDREFSYAQIIGFMLKDEATVRTIGRIRSVDETTWNTLFHLDDGTLIPAHEDLIVDIDVQKNELTMQLPDGLLDGLST